MKRRILQSTLAAVISAAVIFSLLVFGVLLKYFTDQTHSALEHNLRQISIAVNREDDAEGYLEALAAGDFSERLTLIAADGQVLYDSKGPAQQMENHLQREEIQEAATGEIGVSSRESATLGQRTYYYAIKLQNGSFLRISDTRNSVMGMLASLSLYFFAALVLICLAAALLAARATRRIVEPINAINLDVPEENRVYPELKPLMDRMSQQNRRIQEFIQALDAKRLEFDTITGNMAEGLLLLNPQGKILMLNRAARRFLKREDAEGLDARTLSHKEVFNATLDTALRGIHAENVLESEGRWYRLTFNPVYDSGHFTGIVALIPDITDEYLAERNRREFTANISHELKTPLTSIVGCAEIMKNGIAAEKDWKDLVNCIYAEGTRMTHLVEDILYLSKLDSGAIYADREPIDLHLLAKEILPRYAKAAAQKNVNIALSGVSVTIRGMRQITDEMLSNLVDNAVKYNRENGSVTVETTCADGMAVLTVRDTGIGIAPENQPHVFERFFREDKSRSKATGGTGLGLSIVKHAVMILNGRVELKSKPGEGTTITVRIPLDKG